MNDPMLWYIADPMCSWCWGFSPVIDAIREHYRGRLKVALLLGGLRPGTTVAMTPKEREEILHHWHQVHAMTGRTFRFDGVLGEGFVYDSEPASRAVVAMAVLDPEAVFPLFKAIQTAFYADGRDVTRHELLTELAASLGVDRETFQAAFESDTTKEKTMAHFQMARKMDVRGFPSIILQQGEQHQFLTKGYRTLAELLPEIDAWLLRVETPR